MVIILADLVHIFRNEVVLRLFELGVILLEVWIGEHALEEVAADGQSSAGTLAKLTCAEVDAAVFAAHPGACHEFRRDTHEPGIGVIVRCAGLAAELGVTVKLSDVAP